MQHHTPDLSHLPTADKLRTAIALLSDVALACGPRAALRINEVLITLCTIELSMYVHEMR